jgi:NAD(P)-dependent dehydrogenase (short-subunit alcohol dehydrogenase family)
LGVDATFNGTGKTVLITGAASGIGLEAAKQMCAAGCRVLVAARSAEKARLACDEVTRYAGTGGVGRNRWCLIWGTWGRCAISRAIS